MSALFAYDQSNRRPAPDAPARILSQDFRNTPFAFNRLTAGTAYSITIRAGLGHTGLISSALLTNLTEGKHCVLMTPLQPETFLSRCTPEREIELLSALDSGKLTLLSMIGDYTKNIVRFGPQRLLKELALCGMGQGSFLIIDHAEQIFSLHHKDTALDQLAMYQDWLGRHESTALLLFSASVADATLAAGHRVVTEGTGGSARLDYQRDGAELWINFWHSNAGMISEQRIVLDDTGTPAAQRPFFSAAQERLPLAPDASAAFMGHLPAAQDSEEVYYLGDPLAPDDLYKQDHWKQVPNLVALLHATRKARAATVIISVSKNTDWLQLAQGVHTMRVNAGSMLRIVILDSGLSLRYQNEALLLRLGANLVVQEKARAARLPLLLESLQSQVYVRNKGIDYDAAIASATPPRVKGYLPVTQFCKEVRTALSQSRSLEVPCALIVLNHDPAHDPAKSLKRFQLSREGDLLTASATHCYVFLYGCVSVDLQTLLPRLLGLHDIGSMHELVFLNEDQAILATLDQIMSLDSADIAAATPQKHHSRQELSMLAKEEIETDLRQPIEAMAIASNA